MSAETTHALIVLALSTVWSGGAVAEAQMSEPWQAGPIAIAPLVNYSEISDAPSAILPALLAELDDRGVPYVPPDELRAVLRRHRIRAVGGISLDDATLIAQETGATAILLGAADIFVTDGVPEIGVSLRVLPTGSRTVSRAASAAATGRDYVHLFDGGRTLDAATVLADVVAQAFDGLWERPRETTPTKARSAVAVVPFDDASEYGRAGRVVANALLSELVQRGYPVVEPGELRAIALRDADLAYGAVSYPLLDALAGELGPLLVITGTVEAFQESNGIQSERIPQLELSVRTIDVPSRRVTMGLSIEKSGHDTETLFQLGRCHSIGRLAGLATTSLVDRIDEQGDRDDDR